VNELQISTRLPHRKEKMLVGSCGRYEPPEFYGTNILISYEQLREAPPILVVDDWLVDGEQGADVMGGSTLSLQTPKERWLRLRRVMGPEAARPR
jgi:hypothetical protein